MSLETRAPRAIRRTFWPRMQWPPWAAGQLPVFCDVRNICNVVQCFCVFKVLSHELPSLGTGPRRRRLCLSYLWWPLHGSKPSITRAPGACANSLKSTWESCLGTSSPSNSDVITQLFLHMCIYVRTQRHRDTQRHTCAGRLRHGMLTETHT